MTKYIKEGDKYRFELFADYKGVAIKDKWVAVGLSLDAAMGNDAVVACFVDPNGEVQVNNFWNIDNPKFTLPVEVLMYSLEGGSWCFETTQSSLLQLT